MNKDGFLLFFVSPGYEALAEDGNLALLVIPCSNRRSRVLPFNEFEVIQHGSFSNRRACSLAPGRASLADCRVSAFFDFAGFFAGSGDRFG